LASTLLLQSSPAVPHAPRFGCGGGVVSPQTANKRSSAADGRRKEPAWPRLQLEFSPEAYERLMELKRQTGARTSAEVIRKSLHVLDWLLSKTQDDFKLQLVKGDLVREVEIVL
jgi:hypothetical protein